MEDRGGSASLPSASGFNLQTAMADSTEQLERAVPQTFPGGYINTTGIHRTLFGVSSESLPLTDVVFDNLKKKYGTEKM
jgi:hypothetical protein